MHGKDLAQMLNKNLVDKKSCKYVLYARKSTEAKDKQEQSIEDQIRIMKKRAKQETILFFSTILWTLGN